MVLTKDEILNLPTKTKEVQIGEGTIKLRSLTPTELSKIHEITAVGTITTHTTDSGIETSRTIEMSEYVKACETAKHYAIMYSLSLEETWTLEEVQRIPAPILSLLYETISEWNHLEGFEANG